MPAKLSQPYQPLLLRILHGLIAFFVIAAILTAFWTYNTYDGRWGTLPLPRIMEIHEIHGTYGLYSLLVFPFFVLYAFHRGQQRLLQPDSIAQLSKIGKPLWWYTLHRLTNTLSILALTFAVFSGKMMDDTWLPKGELNHGWYYAHLISWVVMVICIALHLLMSAKVGGAALLLSVFKRKFRPKDSPKLWRDSISQWWANLQPLSLSKVWGFILNLNPLEALVLVSIVAAWIISLIKEIALYFG